MTTNNDNIVFMPYDSSGNLVNQIVVYNQEQESKVYYGILRGIQGLPGESPDIGLLKTIVQAIIDANPSLKGESVNFQDVINYLMDYINTHPEQFRGVQGLPSAPLQPDNNVIKSQVNTFLTANAELFVAPINYDDLVLKIDYTRIPLNYSNFNTFITNYITTNQAQFRGVAGTNGTNGTNGKGINLISFDANSVMTILMSDSTTYTSPSLRGLQGIAGIGIQNITFNNGIMTIFLTNGNTYTSPNLKGDSGTITDAQLQTAVGTYLTNNPIQSSGGISAYLTSEIFKFNIIDFSTSVDGNGRAFTFIQDPLSLFAVNGLYSALNPKMLIKNWTTNSVSTMMAGRMIAGTANEFTIYLNVPSTVSKPSAASGITKYINFDQNGITPNGCNSVYYLFCNNVENTPTLNATQLTNEYFWNYIREGFYMSVDYIQGYIKLRFYDQNKIMFFNFIGEYSYSNSNAFLFQWYNNRSVFSFRNGLIASATKTISPALFDISF
jgi:hypothetical protein